MGKMPPGYAVTKLKHIDPLKWYAIDLRNVHEPHILPLAIDNLPLAKRWLISQKFYLPNQVQLIKGYRAIEMGLFIKWNNLPILGMPHKYPGHTGFGNSRKDWKDSIRKELKRADKEWRYIRQLNFYYQGIKYVIYSWEEKYSGRLNRILKSLFRPEEISKIKKRIRVGPKQITPKCRWICGPTQNPSPILINRYNKEHGLKPLDRFPWHGNIALRWRGFIEEHAPLDNKYLKPIT